MLGARVCALTIADLHRLVGDAIALDRQIVVTSQNMHGIRMYHRHEMVRQLHAQAYTRIDGMPLILFGRLLGYPLRREHRVTWVDWIEPLMTTAAEERW